MRALLKHTVLKDAVQRAASVVNRGDARVVVTNLLLDVRADRLRLLGTDLSLGAIVEVPVEAATPGRVCVPASKMLSLVKTLPTGLVMLSLDNGAELSVLGQYTEKDGVASCKSQWLLHGHDPSLYPDFPIFDDSKAMEIEREPFVKVLTRVATVVDAEAKDNDPRIVNLLGVYLADGMAYSTDGHASIREPVCGGLEKLMLPRDAVKLLIDLLAQSGSKYFKLMRSQTFVLVQCDGDTYHSALRDVVFPPIESMLFEPTAAFKTVLLAPRKELIAALDRASVTVNDHFWLSCVWEGGRLTLRTKNIVGDQFVEVLDDVALQEGSELKLERNFDVRRLRKLLQSCRNDKVAMRLGVGTEVKNLILRIEDDGMVAILMPLRIVQGKAS